MSIRRGRSGRLGSMLGWRCGEILELPGAYNRKVGARLAQSLRTLSGRSAQSHRGGAGAHFQHSISALVAHL